tara:strand:- start:11377 stop:13341 length:1965 start_codon:yes stop_codon:yes gene_type:complete
MAEKKFIIEVRTKGFTRATKNVKNLDKDTQSYNKAANRMRGETQGLMANLGSLRNKILVYTFALGGAVAIMNKFVKAASGFQDVKTRLVGLTGSVEEAKSAFISFNKIAATTPFALQDVVNAGAQLQAFGLDAKLTLRATTDLAAFMGTTAVEAASSLGRAFAGGAGAADILRERGILQLIKDSQGIKDLTKLTLPEFRVALIKAMTDPDGRISGSADRLSKTFSGAVTNMQDAMTRFAAQIGDSVIGPLTDVVNKTESFFRALDPKRTAEVATSIGALATAFGILKIQAILANAAFASYGKIAKGIVLAGTLLGIDKLFQFAGTFEHLETAVDDSSDSLNNQSNALDAYLAKIGLADTAINNMAERVEAFQKANKSLLTGYEDQVAALLAQEAALNGKSLVDQETIKNMGIMSPKMIVAIEQIEIITARINSRIAAEKELNRITQSKASKELAQMQAELDMEDFLEEQRQETFKKAKEELDDLNKNASKDLASNMKDSVTSANQFANSILAAASAMKMLQSDTEMTTSKLFTMVGSLLMLVPGGQVPGAMAQAFGMLTAHTGGLVKQNSIQRFAQGGQVQGEDNVPILAQAGEFIMKRSAVQNIGVQNLAKMNRTGSGGGVTINISGNMIGNDEFVRDNLIPEIQKISNQGLA